MARVRCGKAKSSQGIGYDVRGGRQVLAGGSGQIHDTVKAAQHILSLPTGHRHVVHRFGCF